MSNGTQKSGDWSFTVKNQSAIIIKYDGDIKAASKKRANNRYLEDF